MRIAEHARELRTGLLERYAEVRQELTAARRQEESLIHEGIEKLIAHASSGLFRKSVHVDHVKAGYKAIGRDLGGEKSMIEHWWGTRADVTSKHAVNGRVPVHVLRADKATLPQEHSAFAAIIARRRPATVATNDRVEAELQQIVVDSIVKDSETRDPEQTIVDKNAKELVRE